MIKYDFEVEINPLVLKFFISFSGYTNEEICERIGKNFLNMNILEDILGNKKNPEYRILKSIAKLLKKDVSFFLFGKVPKEKESFKTFKKFRLANPNLELEYETKLTVEKYDDLREDINVLMENSGDFENYSIEENPKKVAKLFRKKFEYNKENFKKPADLFKFLRKKIETKNIFIFKNMPSEKLNENLRGVTLLGDELPKIILINSNEKKNGEIYTLLHEFGHILLKESNIDFNKNSFSKNKIEIWCNIFASFFLLNEEEETKLGFKNQNKKFPNEELNTIEKKYFLSILAQNYRLAKNGNITWEEFNEERNKPYKNQNKGDKSGGGDYYNTLRDRISAKYANLMINNYFKNVITLSEMSTYLKINNNVVKQFEKMVEVFN